MIRRLAIVLPTLVLLGCGGTAQVPAESPAAPSAEAAAVGAAAQEKAPAAAKDAAAPVPLGAPAPQAPKAVNRADVVSTDSPLVGTISQADVLAQVNKHQDLFDKCYSIGAATSKNWRAKVTVKASVGPTGSIGSAEIVSSTAKNPKVDACVLDAFKKLSFPRPPGAGATTFTFPLSFDGLVQVQ